MNILNVAEPFVAQEAEKPGWWEVQAGPIVWRTFGGRMADVDARAYAFDMNRAFDMGVKARPSIGRALIRSIKRIWRWASNFRAR